MINIDNFLVRDKLKNTLNGPELSSFRMFCNETWYEHKDEIIAWTGKQVDYDATYYFQKHRWLLKKMLKESTKKG